MPNAKVFVDGKWSAFVVGEAGVTKVFVSDKGTLVVLGDHITEFSNIPFVIEREYSAKNKEKPEDIQA